MSEFHEGDLVQAVKGDTVVRGRLRVPQINNPEDGLFWVGDSGCLIGGLSTLGFTLTVIEKAAPKLPTTPGTVIAIGGWELVKLRLYNVEQPGGWELLPAKDEQVRNSMDRAGVKAQCVYSDAWVRAEVKQDRDGFRIISEPVPVTAKRVLDSVRSLSGVDGDSRINLDGGLDRIAAAYGVTE